ncbi:MAG: IS3 family transposase [Deltaproteobacteria bacterium]|nr:IS3 family transposase [Deltaproteobacteria bacterium]
MRKGYSPEFRERAVRMVLDQRSEYSSLWKAMQSISAEVGCTSETLRKWMRQAEIDSGKRVGQSSSELSRLKELERENKELKQANEILRKAAAFFGPGGARPPTKEMIAFVDDQRATYGVESICRQLPIAPSTFYTHNLRLSDRGKIPLRLKRDQVLKAELLRVFEENFRVYGARKIWRQLKRDGIAVARCTVERLMKQLGIQGAVRGKKCQTTISDDSVDKPLDLVNRQFSATRPDQLWVADITFVATWSGFVYVAFVIDVFSRFIVGWQISRSLRTNIVLDALEQALWARRPGKGLIHHSDRGSQYLSICYSERLLEAGIEASVGSVGDSYDNAMAETINGLYKTEVIRTKGPWKSIEDVEYATLEWVSWFNHRRLLEPIGNIPPAEFENMYYEQMAGEAEVA